MQRLCKQCGRPGLKACEKSSDAFRDSLCLFLTYLSKLCPQNPLPNPLPTPFTLPGTEWDAVTSVPSLPAHGGQAVQPEHHTMQYFILTSPFHSSFHSYVPKHRMDTRSKQQASLKRFFTYTYSYSIYTSVTTRGPKKHYGLGPKDSKAQPCDASHLNREAERLPPFHRAVGTQCDLTRPRSNTVTEPRTALRPAAFRWESLSPRPSSILLATRSSEHARLAHDELSAQWYAAF